LGVEYEKLHGFLQKVGITYQISFPHAPQQNGSTERKHSHIVEVGLAFLSDASTPLKFWDDTFLRDTFPINMLPTKVLNFLRPTYKNSSMSHLIMCLFEFLLVLVGSIVVLTINANFLL
jgi:hypothetical protein